MTVCGREGISIFADVNAERSAPFLERGLEVERRPHVDVFIEKESQRQTQSMVDHTRQNTGFGRRCAQDVRGRAIMPMNDMVAVELEFARDGKSFLSL